MTDAIWVVGHRGTKAREHYCAQPSFENTPAAVRSRTDGVGRLEDGRRVYFEVFNGGNLEAVDDLIHPEHENHDPTAPDVPKGPEGVRRLVELYRSAFPDIRFEREEIVVAGEGSRTGGPSRAPTAARSWVSSRPRRP
jgi:hypothetical protein